jgi:hypothetical protein
MTTKEELIERVLAAKREVMAAEAALAEWESLPENNVFATVEQASAVIENALLAQASDDCEGAHNCGAEKYTREFMVDDKTYVGTLTVEYNRHDKTYYYIDGYEFGVAEKQPA